VRKLLTFANTGRTRTWGGALLLLALAMGCNEGNLLENRDPSFAAGGSTSLSVNLDQFANGSGKTAPSWQNGDLNGNNSHYPPDGAVPFRLAIEGLPPGTHSIHVNYDWTAGGHHAYDFLASVDAFVKAAGGLNICVPNGGTGTAPSSLCTKTGTTYSLSTFAQANFDKKSFGADGYSNDGLIVNNAFTASSQLTAGEVSTPYAAGDPRSLIIFGGTISAISTPDHQGNVNGNSTADMVVTFSTTNCSTAPCAVFLVWSGHLADDQGANAFWDQAAGGVADGASTISGAPWHMRTQNLTENVGPNQVVAGNKNQDRSIQPSAIVVESPNLSITKTPDASTVNAGDSVKFTITVSNSGPGVASNVVMTDTLQVPASSGVSWGIVPNTTTGTPTCAITTGTLSETILTCTKASLAAAGSFSVTVGSATTATACASYPNLAHAVADNNTEVTDPGSITVQCPGLQISKTPDNGTANAGDSLKFTITVTNPGPGTAVNVVMKDTLPVPTGSGVAWGVVTGATTGTPTCGITAGGASETILTCTKASMAANTSFSVTVGSTSTSASCTQYPNLGHVRADNNPHVQDNGDITVSCPTLSVAKTPDNGSVNAGDSLKFAITVTNNGPGIANSVALTDTLPLGSASSGISYGIVAGTVTSGVTCNINTGALQEKILVCTKPSLAASGSFSVTLGSSTTSAACGSYPNKAHAEATGVTEVNDNGSVTVNCPSLQVSKTPDAGTVNAGSPIVFTVTVTNSGAGTATNVSLIDTLPLGTGVTTYSVSSQTGVTGCTVDTGLLDEQILNCTKSSLAASGSFSVTVTSNNTTSASCANYPNLAHAGADNNAEAHDDGDVTVNCPTLSIDKTPHTQTVTAGNSFSWTVTLHNVGPGVASSAKITDTLPVITGVTYSTATSGCQVNTGTLGERIFVCGPTDLASAADLAGVVTASTTARAGCGAYTNTARGAGTGLTDVSYTANLTVGGCTTGQILPTQSTCSSFTGGDPSLPALLATITKGKINNVTPGVWFYFLSVIAPTSSFTVNIRESNTGGLANFQINNGQVNAYTAGCTTFNGATVTLQTSGNPTGADVAFTGATAGALYIIGVKYQGGTTLDGLSGNVIPQTGVPYSYTTQLNGGAVITDDNATITLSKK
jgi:uncharacterized repeat protein (TIGR01451 family)